MVMQIGSLTVATGAIKPRVMGICLRFFQENIPALKEVSIGHALISDALYFGLENTVQMYLRLLK